MEGHNAQKCGILGMLLERIVDDIFDSSASDSSFEDDDDSSDIETLEQSEYHDGSSKRLLSKEISNSSLMIDEKIARIEAMLSSYGPEEFKKHFMISQETYNFILNLIGDELLLRTSGAGPKPIPPRIQLLIALRKMCSADSYRIICEEFVVGKTSALRSLTRVIRALCSYSSTYIVWPKGSRVQEVCRGFQTMSGVPKVIGSLECIPIKTTEQSNPDASLNTPKDRHRVQLQVVVDHEGRFTHCSVFAGDSRIKQDMLNSSSIHDYLSDSSRAFPDNCHLVAGPEYDLHEHVMVAYSGPDLSEEQKCFNEHLGRAHSCVALAFSTLKKRFASVRRKLGMFRADMIPIFIMACCVLHNICLDQKDFITGPFDVPAKEGSSTPRQILARPGDKALKKRDALCRQVYLSKAEGFVFV